MAQTVPQPEHVYEIRVDQIDVTRGGLFGGGRDTMRQFVSGPKRYFIDGVEVSHDEYVASMAQIVRPVRVFVDGDEFAFDSDGATRADGVFVGTLQTDDDGRTVFVPAQD